MTDAQPRKLTCARCRTDFGCTRDAQCWCAAVPYQLRMTDRAAQDDCLCPDCLRQAAAAQDAARTA